MPLKHRKPALGVLRQTFKNEKELDIPHNDPVDVPISVLRTSRFGTLQVLLHTSYRRTDTRLLIGDNHYYVPRCMQEPGTTDLDPSIRKYTCVFKKEYAPESTAEKQEPLMGIYSIWFKGSGTIPDLTAMSQIDGDFWILKQLQNEPQRGDMIGWGQITMDMATELTESNHWWYEYMGVFLPKIGNTMIIIGRGGEMRLITVFS